MTTAVAHSVESSNLADILERVLDKGIVIAGDIRIKLVDIELLTIQIRLMIASVERARELGMDWWTRNPAFQPAAPPVEVPPSRREATQARDPRRKRARTSAARG